ncbi:MAG: MFS transporter [Promethearchaeota archaeon]
MKNETPVKLKGSQIFLLGVLGGAGAFFGTAENGQLNTWINNVIRYDLGGQWGWWMVPLMTTFSAMMGMIFLLVWGAVSDNTRTKWGRRRPFILGGIVAGLAMIFYVLTSNFWFCFFLDVVVIGVFMNMLLAGNKALIPDMTEPQERGRVNARITIISGLFSFVSIAIFLVSKEFFYGIDPHSEKYLNIVGHYIVLVTTGIVYILIAILTFFTIKEPPLDDSPRSEVKWYRAIGNSFKFSELKKEKEFFKMLIATLVFNVGTKMFLPWIFEFVTALDPSFIIIGIVLLEYIFLGFTLSIILGKVCDKYGRKKPLILTILVGSVGFLMIPAVVQTMNLVLLFVAIGLILLILNGTLTILGAWTQDLLPDEKRGQFLGINNLSSTVNQMIGVWIGGVIYNMFTLKSIAIAWQMFYAVIFFIASIPIFLKIKETIEVEEVGTGTSGRDGGSAGKVEKARYEEGNS